MTPICRSRSRAEAKLTAPLATIAFALPVAVVNVSPCSSFSYYHRSVWSAPPSTNIGWHGNGKFFSALNLFNEKDDGGVELAGTLSPDVVGEGGRDNGGSAKSPLELASWYAVEAFGKAFGSRKSIADATQAGDCIDISRQPSSLEETVVRIRTDNDRSYFLSGEVDRLIYDEKCTFADPFVSFDGRDRFIENLSNLGSFISDYEAKMIKYDVSKDGQEIVTKFMVKLKLNLPWKPVLAWPWGVLVRVDPDTFLVTLHQESWDIEPWEGVLQIFRRPTAKVRSK